MQFGGHVDLGILLIKLRATTAKSKFTVEDFAEKNEFFNDLVTTVEMEEIPPELILNWDQTSIKLVPVSSHTLERQGSVLC